MPMRSKDIVELITTALPGATVEIKDLAGDGDHYEAHVVAPQFLGKTRIQQHQLVYQALQGRMGAELHALALRTTPSKN